MSQGAGPVSPPINEHSRTVVFNRKGGVVCVRIVYTQHESVEVLQVTGSLLLLVLVCCCIVLCYRSSCESLHVPGLCLESLIQFVCGVRDNPGTVPRDSIVGMMASGDSRPGADLSGVSFRVHIQVNWNVPESVVALDSPGVVVLDISYVPDVLGLRTRNSDAKLVRVLPRRAQDSVGILIPDAKAVASGFHDITLIDMADAAGLPSPWGTFCGSSGLFPVHCVRDVPETN